MLTVKFIDHLTARETILPDVSRVSFERDPLGAMVTIALPNDETVQFGPMGPHDHPAPVATLYVMNDNGKTVGDYTFFPGDKAAWDKLAMPDAPVDEGSEMLKAA